MELKDVGLVIIICPGGIAELQEVPHGLGLGQLWPKRERISIGTGVTAPILRYHPAIVAQVFATLAFMFPNRVFLGIGRGEALNEVTSGNEWPSSVERFARLREALQLIKKLWSEDWVDFRGNYYLGNRL